MAEFTLLTNPRVDRQGTYPVAFDDILSAREGTRARTDIARWKGYAPTPLRDLPDMARSLGIGQILYKDEGSRFELASFKALGGALAVERLATRHGHTMTVTCATDGNHGRAVAWGAARAGCRAVIYIHEGVSEGRAAAIRRFGAEVRREGRTYDDSVRICAEVAAREGWQIVSDTSWPGYTEVPKIVMQGYAVLAMEALEAGARPTHIFLQGGVGGMAAGVLSWFWQQQGAGRPIAVVVEPDRAACLLASVRAGRLDTVGGDLDTVMAGLACGEPSALAWEVLSAGADAFMAIPDSAAIDTMKALAAHRVVGGESGVAGLAGLRLVAGDAEARRALRLDSSSRVLCFGTEGATDPEVYTHLVGRTPEAVAAGA
jgi:diaminopropionate ammonia-lyase